jgi:hypothetical protein
MTAHPVASASRVRPLRAAPSIFQYALSVCRSRGFSAVETLAAKGLVTQRWTDDQNNVCIASVVASIDYLKVVIHVESHRSPLE